MAVIHRVVVTGGPCAGKTTCLAQLSEWLEGLGFLVFRVPEAATLLFGGGASLAGASLDEVLHFQARLLRLQMALEESFLLLADKSGQPSVVIFDRGCMDAAAYVEPAVWHALLDDNGWSEVALRDHRYDAVLHLVTAAIGAEAFYTTANNTARTENTEEAAALDHRLRDAWTGHPHLRLIDNSSDFASKIRRVIDAICRVVEVPSPREIERKFLLRGPAPAELPVFTKAFTIEQTYLVPNTGAALRSGDAGGAEERVRSRTRDGVSTYTHTIKRPLTAGQRIEIERQIRGREYLSLLCRADPERLPIRKTRRCFLWQERYFELDVFEPPHAGLAVLEIELEHLDDEVVLPPFLEVEREVTSDPSYSNASLARRAEPGSDPPVAL